MIANARMYALNEEVGRAWRTLFAWIGARANVSLDVIEHPTPRPLAELWRRPDLGCAMMCGYPWATWDPAAGDRPVPLAAPIPSPSRYRARPEYWSDIVVRADSRLASERELAGRKFLFTVMDSQSGYQAPRAFFAREALAAGGRLFSTTIGPVVTPRRVVDTVIAGGADAGPLDAWWHDLLCRHEPLVAARLRTLAHTPRTPMPFMVCAAAVGVEVQARLKAALDAVTAAPELAPVRDTLLLSGFARVDPADYATLADRAREIDALGYPRLQ